MGFFFFILHIKNHTRDAFSEPAVTAKIVPETRQGKEIEFIKDKRRMFCLLTDVQNTTLSDSLQSRTVAASPTVLTASALFTSVAL